MASASQHAVEFHTAHATLRHSLPPREAAIADAARRSRYDRRWSAPDEAQSAAQLPAPHQVFDVYDGRRWVTVKVVRVDPDADAVASDGSESDGSAHHAGGTVVVEPVSGRAVPMIIPLSEFHKRKRVVPVAFRAGNGGAASRHLAVDATARRDERMRLAERMIAAGSTTVAVHKAVGVSEATVRRNKYVALLAVDHDGKVVANAKVGPAFPKRANREHALEALAQVCESLSGQPCTPGDVEPWLDRLQGHRSVKKLLYEIAVPDAKAHQDDAEATELTSDAARSARDRVQIVFVPPFTSAPLRKQIVARAAASPAAQRAEFLREVADPRSALHGLFLSIHKHNPGVTAAQLLSSRGLDATIAAHTGAASNAVSRRIAKGHVDESNGPRARTMYDDALRWPAECRRWIRAIQQRHPEWAVVSPDGIVSFERWRTTPLREADIAAARRAVGLSRKRMAVAPAESTKLPKMLEYEAFLNIQKRLNAENLVFFDEVSIEMLGNTPMGWSLGGKRAVSRRPASLGLKTHVIGAIAWPDLHRPRSPFWFIRVFPPMGNNVETFKEWRGAGAHRRPVYRLTRYPNAPPPKEEFRTEGCTRRIYKLLKEHNERLLDAPDVEAAGSEDILKYEGTRDPLVSRSRRRHGRQAGSAAAHNPARTIGSDDDDQDDDDDDDEDADADMDVVFANDPLALFRYTKVDEVQNVALRALQPWRTQVLEATHMWLKNLVAVQHERIVRDMRNRHRPAALTWLRHATADHTLTVDRVLSAEWPKTAQEAVQFVHPEMVEDILRNHVQIKLASRQRGQGRHRGGTRKWEPDRAALLRDVFSLRKLNEQYTLLRKRLERVKTDTKPPVDNLDTDEDQLRLRLTALLKLAGVYPPDGRAMRQQPASASTADGADKAVTALDWTEPQDADVGRVLRPALVQRGEGVVQAYSIDSAAMLDFFLNRLTDDFFFRLDKTTDTFYWRTFVCDGAAWHGRQRAPLSVVAQGATGKERQVLSRALEPHVLLKQVKHRTRAHDAEARENVDGVFQQDVADADVPRRRRADAKLAFERRNAAAKSACRPDWLARITDEHRQAAAQVMAEMKRAANQEDVAATRSAMLLAAQDYLAVGSARQQFRTTAFKVRSTAAGGTYLEHQQAMKTSPLYHAITRRRSSLRKRFEWLKHNGRMKVGGRLYTVHGEPPPGDTAHDAMQAVYRGLEENTPYAHWKPDFKTAMNWFADKTSYKSLHPGPGARNVSKLRHDADPLLLSMQSKSDFESHMAAGPDVLVFTPAYQPMFNPIERIFSVAKAALRREDIGGLHKNGALIVADRMDDPFMTDDQTGSRLRRDVSRGIHRAFRQVSPAAVMNNILCSGYSLPGDDATPEPVRRRIGIDYSWPEASMLSRSAKDRLQYEWFMLQHDCRLGADVRKTGTVHRRILTFDGNRCLRRGTRWFGFQPPIAAREHGRSAQGPQAHPLSAPWQAFAQPARFPKSTPVAKTGRFANDTGSEDDD